MYDRAPRLLKLTEGSGTEDCVGPGSYQVPFLKQQVTGGYAPFLSLTNRESYFTVGCNNEKAVPGPGHYNVSKAQFDVKGGRSLQYSDKRFKRFISDGPGPACYDQSYPRKIHFKNKKIPEDNGHFQWKNSRALSSFRTIDVPSIPSCERAYGYHINEDDTIIKHFPPTHDSTLGPAFYKPQYDVFNATSKYKGIHFSNSSGRRDLPPKQGPGPGHYEIGQEKTPHYENINIKKEQQQDCSSYFPRFYDVIISQEEKKGVPGPGRYDIKSQFQKTESMTPDANEASPAFLSQSQRFVPMKSITPAPGTYNVPQSTIKSSKKTPGLKMSAFGQTAARFTQEFETEEMPGPGFYNVLNSTIADNVKNICLGNKKNSAFGSSVPRTLILVQKEALAVPGPAEYQVSEIPEELPDLTNQYAVFLSRTERIPKQPDKCIPAPGRYDVQKSYDMSQGKQKYMPPRSLVAKRKHSSFLSAAPRCSEKIKDGPGPATYNPTLKRSCFIPAFVKTSKRFEDCKVITPGPATYELSPFLRHSVLKRTFNVTLPNPTVNKGKSQKT
ncbi:sperm-tail PG-rich repeat-containing protein 2 [Echinops telfairi]|uniref:Sperm-tail PG-rich repeat-containing protein 2 n=1 Tax=Echinops telfairi TaxID=9371 RepID=A0AC55CJY9_ECHTE|nr:sperm-tail PG-rich repeat-containing protein 2 [Echinops telfairi]